MDVDIAADTLQVQSLGGGVFSNRYYEVMKGVAAELSEEALQYVRTERVPLLFNTVSNRKNPTN